MNSIDFHVAFGRTTIIQNIKQRLLEFDAKCKDITYKKGIYIYGAPGSGKTYLIHELLRQLNYDPICFDAGDIRNKSLVDTITSNNVGQCNVLDMMRGRPKKIAVIMDEIDGMQKGDKGGISALVKLIRQKKTKKQKSEHQTMNPILCIGNYYMDKKIRELMKVCYVFELPVPTDAQMADVLCQLFPMVQHDAARMHSMIRFIQGDFRKLQFLWTLYQKKPDAFFQSWTSIFQMKHYNEDYARIVEQLYLEPVSLSEHSTFMNENDRTTVALLWHENIVDRLSGLPRHDAFALYQRLTDNICFADYMDRITFQNQIWIFNEMSSLMKTVYNNKIYHDTFEAHGWRKDGSEDMQIRFTKILTKYSTEYSNMLFYNMLAQELDMDKKDVASFFQDLRLTHGMHFADRADKIVEVERMFQDTTKIKRLDIRRLYRYLDKNVKRDGKRGGGTSSSSSSSNHKNINNNHHKSFAAADDDEDDFLLDDDDDDMGDDDF